MKKRTFAIAAFVLLLAGSITSASIIGEFSVFGHDKVTIGANIAIDKGLVGGNSDIVLGNGASVHIISARGHMIAGTGLKTTDDIHVGGSIDVKSGSNIAGNVRAGTHFKAAGSGNVGSNVTLGGTLNAGGGFNLGGSLTELAIVPPPDLVFLPATQSISPGGMDITTDTTNAAPLLPGQYRDVVFSNTFLNLHLVGGTYHFRNIDAFNAFQLHLDLTGGPITILVEGDIDLDTNVKVFVNGVEVEDIPVTDPSLADLAAQVFIESHGSVSADNMVSWFGTTYTPTGDIIFGTNTTLVGAIHSGGEVNVDNFVSMQHVPYDPTPAQEPQPNPQAPGIPEPVTALLLAPAWLMLLRRR